MAIDVLLPSAHRDGLKGLDAERRPVHLVRNGGEHLGDAYRSINPQARLPSLQLDDGRC